MVPRFVTHAVCAAETAENLIAVALYVTPTSSGLWYELPQSICSLETHGEGPENAPRFLKAFPQAILTKQPNVGADVTASSTFP